MYLEWYGEILADVDGYGIHTRRLLKVLLEGGLDIKLVQYGFSSPRKTSDPYWTAKLAESKEKKDAPVRICFSIPPLIQFNPNAKNIIYVNWETSRLPDKWVPMISQAPGLLATSSAVVQAIQGSGISCGTEAVVYCPIDCSVWNREGPSITLSGVSAEDVVFLSVGSWQARKSILELVTAFAVAMHGVEDAVLVVKTWGGDNSAETRQTIHNHIGNHLNNLPGVKRPRVNVITDLLSEEQVVKLYRRANVYTTATRGEGLNLGLLQAMACGCLCVATDFMGHKDYILPDNSLPVKYSLTPVVGTGIPDYSCNQLWANIDMLDYVNNLRDSYFIVKDRKYLSLTEKAVQLIRSKFNPESVCKSFTEAVKKYF